MVYIHSISRATQNDEFTSHILSSPWILPDGDDTSLTYIAHLYSQSYTSSRFLTTPVSKDTRLGLGSASR